MSNYTKDNLIPITHDSVPKGTLAIKIGDEIFTPMNPDGGTDTSDANVTASDVSEGLVFYGKDGRETGTMPDVTASKNENVVTVPAGRIREEQTVTVGTAQAAKTYTPGTTDQTIASGKYLTGAQTIKGDANLLPENIKKDVSIFGIPGTFEGGSSMEFYRCASASQGEQYYEVSNASQWPDCNGKYYLTDLVCTEDKTSPVWKHESNDLYLYGIYNTSVALASNYNAGGNFYRANYSGGTFPESGWEEVDGMENDLQVSLKTSAPTEKTWSGNKAVWSDAEGYGFEETVTEGLTYGAYLKPVVGKIYDANARVCVAKLFMVFPAEENLIFYAPLTSQSSIAETGQSISYSGCEFTTNAGIACMRCSDGTSTATVNIPTIPQGSSARTISFWGCADSYTSDWMGFFSYGTDAANQLVCVRTNSGLASIGFSYNDHNSTINVAGSWHHFAMTYDGSVAKLYVDGITAIDATTAIDTTGTELKIGAGVNARTGYRGYIAAFRVYDRALSANEITVLAREF